MHKPKWTLGKRQSKNHLSHPRTSLMQFRVLLEQFVHRSFALFHNSHLDRSIFENRMCKRFILFWLRKSYTSTTVFILIILIVVVIRRRVSGAGTDIENIVRWTVVCAVNISRILVMFVILCIRIIRRKNWIGRSWNRFKLHCSQINILRRNISKLENRNFGFLQTEFKEMPNVLGEPRTIA